MQSPHKVTRDFEAALCGYTGAPYAVTTNSCTMALFLACKWLKVATVEIPKRTYVSVPMSIIHAGGSVTFRDEDWRGAYKLEPYPIWDSAQRLRRGMYADLGGFVCVSFHWNKPLGIQQGGAILHDDPNADSWFRRARFDGRTEGVHPSRDDVMLGWHCYMSPEVAAAGLVRLSFLPEQQPERERDLYPDLSEMMVFRNGRNQT